MQKIVAAAIGYYHYLLLDSKGTVYSFGNNENGQLSFPDFLDRERPVQLSNLPKIQAITAGSGFSLALGKEGTVFSWGSNCFGQLGRNTLEILYEAFGSSQEPTESDPTPTKIPFFKNIVQIASGDSFSLVLNARGEVFTFGYLGKNDYGQGNELENLGEIRKVPNLAHIRSICVGENHCFALTGSGEVFGWGLNEYGVLGTGDTKDRFFPEKIPNLPKMKKIVAGSYFSLGLSDTGQLFGWGYNRCGQIFPANFEAHILTPRTWTRENYAKDIAASFEFSYVRTYKDKILVCGPPVPDQLPFLSTEVFDSPRKDLSLYSNLIFSNKSSRAIEPDLYETITRDLIIDAIQL